MRTPLFISAALLVLGLACTGGTSSSVSSSTAATGFSYTDPTGTGWRLVKASSSTATRLVLNLVGPTGLKTRGAGFNLQLPAGVRAGGFPGETWPVRDLGVYQLWNVDPMGDGSVAPGEDPLEPRLISGGVKPGNLLTVGIFQKDRRATAKESGQPLCQIALEFKAGEGVMAGDLMALAVTKARHIAEDVGPFDVNPTLAMAVKAKMVDMPIALGTLRAQ